MDKSYGLALYDDLAADVRYTGQYERIKELVVPDDPEVRELARILVQDRDFIEAAHEFVHSYTHYEMEPGDFWGKPFETLLARYGDCDCLAILLCSILRNYIPAEEVFCAFGTWMGGGHMWVVTKGEDGQDRLIEATASPSAELTGRYDLQAMFNDKYVFATRAGLTEFDLIPVEEKLFASGR